MPLVRQHGIIAGSEGWRKVKNQKEIEMKALRVFTLAALMLAAPLVAETLPVKRSP